MNIHEYQAKDLFEKFSVPSPKGSMAESPEEAKKRGYKAVVKREVVRLVTPGTLTEDNFIRCSKK